MPTWKKVIVSGSNAHLTSVTASTAVLVGTNQQITTSPSTTFLSGSFSGSFTGNGSGLTGITATFPTTQLTPITGTTQVFINDGANKYATISQFNSSSWAGVSGDILINGTTGVATIQPDSVALGTDTTGNYVASVANGTGITTIAAASEGASVTVSISGASALNTNTVTKWTGNAFANSLITDNGTTVTVGGNLTVTGTASFQQTTNLEVADRFVLLASGSNSTGDGGIVVQQATNGIGELLGWDSGTSRWSVTGSFTADQTSFTPDAYVSLVSTAAGTTPAPATRYNAVGNIYVSTGDESIWIYS